MSARARRPARASLESTFEEALQHAQDTADSSGIPQTVYRDAETFGWWHTNAFSERLRGTDRWGTRLPANYFS